MKIVQEIKGSSLTFSAQGGRGKEKYLTAKKSAVGSEGAAEGGCGGNSAAPERNQTEASPAALLTESRTPQKSFLFLLEEKIRGAHIRKSEENFFVGWRASASGGAASLVPFKIGSREVYNYSTKCNLFGIDCSARRVRRAPQGKIRFCFRRKIPEFAPITI